VERQIVFVEGRTLVKTLIKLEKTECEGYCTYKAYWENGKYLGDLEPMDDGYYAYWPADRGGAFTQELLHQLYLELDKLNSKWDSELKENLRKLESKLKI
jgi:hypothetical protein